MNRKIEIILFTLIIFTSFFLRFYKLGEIPYGFYQDESAIGYNAYSILETGRDEYGKFMPLYFKSFGDWKLPVYIYSTVLSIKIFGLTEFAVRFPSAFFGFLTVIMFYFFIKELINEKRLTIRGKEIDTNYFALISSFILAINPWHLHYSRATFEVSISLFLFIVGGLLLLKSFNKRSKGAFLMGTICFIISFYSYNLTRLLAPALYLLFVMTYKKQMGNIKKIEIISTFIISFIFLVPFLKTFFSGGGISSSSGTLITTSAQIQANLLEFRAYLVDLSSLFTKIFFNLKLLTLWKYIENIASYLSSSFFFITGSTHGNHGIGNVGQFYLIEILFISLGAIEIFNKKYRWGFLLFGWSVLTILVAALTRESPHATRSFFLIAPFVIFSAYGFIFFTKWLNDIKNYKLKVALFVVIGSIIIYNLIFYFTSYYIRFPVIYAKAWRSEDKKVALFIKEHETEYEKIIFDKYAGFIYTSLLFYIPYSPWEFQKTTERLPDDSEGFSEVKSFGKYEFRDIDWGKDLSLQRTLIITSENRKPKEVSTVEVFNFPSRPVVFSLKQKIIQYPVEENAYVLIKSGE
ncbi:MAG: glycosyltransferase family 39 protein [Candidatus Levybacteria bacterium]|nr:glycosyltransferase family 39 protein [Candidatus Levybacteria bacterium]